MSTRPPWEDNYGAAPASGSGKPWEQRYNYRQSNAGAAFLSGAADMATFGWGDELQGALFGREAMERARQRQQLYRTTDPGWFMGGQLAGGVLGGGALGLAGRVGLRAAGALPAAARLAGRVGPLGRIAAGATVGAGGGALYGAGDALDGGRVEGALAGIGPGAIGGAGGQVLGEALGAGMRVAGRMAGPEAAAASMVSGAQRRFGQVGDNFTQALADAPEGALVMDVLPGGPQLAMGAAARPSKALPKMDAALRERNQTLAQQTIDDIWSSLHGTGRQSAGVTIRGLQNQRAAQAKPLYDRAFSRPVEWSRAQNLLGPIIKRNPELFRAAATDARALMLAENNGVAFPITDGRFWHYLQQGADQVFERMRSTPGGLASNQRRVMSNALRQYRTGLQRLLGQDFRQAQRIWSNASRQEAAVERGYLAVKQGANDLELEELADEMNDMTPSELEHMRLGALTRLTDMIENSQSTTGRANPVRAILRSRGQERVLRRLFGGQQQLDEVIRRIEQRQQLFENSVASGIGVGSNTAHKLAANESQVAQTNPFRSSGGLWDRLENMVLRGAADRWDENVSNQILDELRIPAPDALRQIQNAGGVEQWARGRGLLAAAQRQALEDQTLRQRALANALVTNAYWGSAGGMGASE